MKTEMASNRAFITKNELYGSPVAKYHWMPNYNYWAFFMIILIRMN